MNLDYSSINKRDISFNNSFINNTLEELRKMKDYCKLIITEYNIIINKIKQYINNSSKSQYLNELNSIIDKYINFLQKANPNKDNDIQENNNHHYNLKTTFNKYYNEISDLFKDKSIIKINELNEIIENIIHNIQGFISPTTNQNSDNNSKNKSDNNNNNFGNIMQGELYKDKSGLDNFYGSFDNSKIIEDVNESQICDGCEGGKAFKYCTHCKMMFCISCCQEIEKGLANHFFIDLDEDKVQNQKEKEKFLNSFLNIIKEYIFKCNYIIKNEEYNFIDKDTFRKFQYPYIQDEKNLNNQKFFLDEINDVYRIIKNKIDINNSINEEELCDLLYVNFNRIVFPIYNQYDIYDMKFWNESYKGNEKIKIIKQQEEKEKKINNARKNNKLFYMIINIINTKIDNYNSILDNEEIIKDKISKVFFIHNDNIIISKNDKRIFMDNFIKLNIFNELSHMEIKNNYSNIQKLYEYKLIIDGLIRHECTIPEECLNYKYNFITPNTSLNLERGKEIYNPPYGWIGIGLDIYKKYNEDNNWINLKDNTSKWAIAYYGFGENVNENEIKTKLYNIIIKKDLKKDKEQPKCHYYDKRHKKKKIGVGIYMSPYIDVAEKMSGLIQFNNKRYKIVLMARVLIEKIREPDDNSFWVLNPNDIRFYRILLREISY